MDLNYQFVNKDLIEEGLPVLVFLHEGLGSIGQWKGFPKLLCDLVQMPGLIYDRYGYGQSPQGPQVIDAQFLHREAWLYLPEFIESLGIQNPLILFGHSDGGTISLLQAAKPMSQLMACIVEAPHVILEKESFGGIRSARSMLDNPSMIERFSFYHGHRSASLIDAWTSMWLSLEDDAWEMKSDLKEIRHPLCLIQGDEDTFGTFKQLDIVADLSQSEQVEIHQLSNCGHVPHLQNTQKVLEISKAFIASLLRE